MDGECCRREWLPSFFAAILMAAMRSKRRRYWRRDEARHQTCFHWHESAKAGDFVLTVRTVATLSENRYEKFADGGVDLCLVFFMRE
jgi:hypothetical protein